MNVDNLRALLTHYDPKPNVKQGKGKVFIKQPFSEQMARSSVRISEFRLAWLVLLVAHLSYGEQAAVCECRQFTLQGT